jgi:Protein of unknown function (DUF2809)
MAGAPPGATTRRLANLIGIAASIVVGGASRLLPIGQPLWDKSVGDAAYATMMFFIVAFARPHARSIVVGAISIAICIAIECFQLTGIPLRLPRVFQIVLGTHFAWHDVACYVVGSGLATLLHAGFSARATPR